MAEKLRVGIVGCGWFGNVHLDYLLTRNDVEVVALASTNPEKLERTGERAPSARRYESPEALIADGGVDALVLCVPPHRHNGIEVLAAGKGLHMYVEKPLGIDLEAAQAAAEAIRVAGVVCAVGYQARYEHGVVEMREYLRQHPAGLVQSRWVGDEPGTPWWRDKAQSGGQVVEQSTHIVDMMRYLLGEVEAVYATAQHSLPAPLEGGTVEGGSTAVLWFQNGAVGSLTTGCFNDREKAANGIGMQAYCREGQVEVDWTDGIRFLSNQDPLYFRPSGRTHADALGVFVDAALSGDASGIRSSYDDALETFRLTLAIEESIRAGEKVRL